MRLLGKLKRKMRKLADALMPCSRMQYARLKARCERLEYLLMACMPEEKRKLALEILWKSRKPGTLDLDAPKTFCEKIQAIKLMGDDPLLTRLADKYAVRDWVAGRIGTEYLIPLLGVWKSADEIDFGALPSRFVLKANHGYHMNIVVKDKSVLDVTKARRLLARWLGTNFAYSGLLQMQYRAIPPRIIAEEYLENGGGQLYDYKFWCFKGRVRYVQYMRDRVDRFVCSRFFDRDWNALDIMYNKRPRITDLPSRPDNLEKMISLAEALADGFEFVRVDFYRLNDGTVKFGEMTFTPVNGYGVWDPPEMDLKAGEFFDVRPGNRMIGSEPSDV